MLFDFLSRPFGSNDKPSRSFEPRLDVLEDRVVPSTFFVTNTADSGVGSLRDAIEQANALEGKDRIVFTRGARGEIELSSELTITDDLVIRGPGAGRLTVSGENATRVFRVDSDPDLAFSVPGDLIDVEIRNLTVANGLATDAPGFPTALFPGFGFGGGLFNRGNDVTLVGVRMTGNHAGDGATLSLGAGGAIANEFGGNLTIQHSTLDNNRAFGGIGGGIYNKGDLTLRHAVLSGNEAIGLADVLIDTVPGYVFTGAALGGGLFNFNSVEVIGTTFDGNRAIGPDGAVGPNILLDGAVTFPGIAVGGGLYNLNQATVTTSRFVGNEALGGSGNFGSFSGQGFQGVLR